MTLVQLLRQAGSRLGHKTNIYDDAADQINTLEARCRELEAERGQWQQRGSIVGIIIRDEEGKDWKWDGKYWTPYLCLTVPETGTKP